MVGQFAIWEKTNELTALPALVDIIEMEGSTITIDAIGATGNIIDVLHNNGGEFVLQVKRNCPALYEELMKLFDGLSEDKKTDEKEFQNKHGDYCSEIMTSEKNRERYEYRKYQSYSDKDGIKAIQEERSHVACVGRLKQVRIMQVQDDSGNDITLCLADFLREGSRKQPKPTDGGRLRRCHTMGWSGIEQSA